MKIGGFQKNSFIDYPGKISCILFTRGCNFRCPYCHNPELVLGPFHNTPLIDPQGIFDFLEDRKGLLEGVVISGGEPTLQEDLALVCQRFKEMDYAVKLDTNGSRPQVVKKLLDDGILDFVAMDIKTDPGRYGRLTPETFKEDDLLESIHLIMASGTPYEFRTTCVKPFVDVDVLETIGKMIKGAERYALQTFRHGEKLLRPEEFEGLEPGYTGEEMEGLKTIVEPWVETCILR